MSRHLCFLGFRVGLCRPLSSRRVEALWEESRAQGSSRARLEPAPRGPRPPDTPGLSPSVGLGTARGPTHIDRGGGRAVPRCPKSSLGREVWWLVVQRDRDGAGEQGGAGSGPDHAVKAGSQSPAHPARGPRSSQARHRRDMSENGSEGAGGTARSRRNEGTSRCKIFPQGHSWEREYFLWAEQAVPKVKLMSREK